MRDKAFVIMIILSVLMTSITYGYTAGETLKSYGVISGDQYGNLNEGMKLNRADMAVLLAALNGKSQQAKSFKLKSTFNDVAPTKWYAPYIAYAEAMGWTHGVGSGKYAPEANVSVKDTAAFLMNILEKKYNYSTVISEANSVGIKTGLSGNGDILRRDVFSAMLDTLNVTPEGENKKLGILLGYLTENEEHKNSISVDKVTIASESSFVVIFNADVDDRSEYTFKIRKLESTIPTTVTWNDSKYKATLESSSKLLPGVYGITVLKSNSPIFESNLIVENRKVSSIQITSPTISIVSTQSGTKGYAAYRVYDQYGNDMTDEIPSKNLAFGSSVGTVSGGGGSLAITPYSSAIGFSQSSNVSLSVVESSSGISTNMVLPAIASVSTLAEFKLSSSMVSVQNNSSDSIYISYQAIDLIGMPTKNYDIITAGLNDINYSGVADTVTDLISIGNSAGVKVEVVRDPLDLSKALIKVTPGNVTLTSDTELIITATTQTGKTSTAILKVLK